MSEMEQNEFDRELTKAMRRVDPPETLARFLAQAVEVDAKSRLPGERRSHRAQRRAWFAPRSHRATFGWMGAALAAMLLVCVFIAQQVHVRHEREQAAVQQQFDEGMRVTDRALDQTRAKLERAGLKLGN